MMTRSHTCIHCGARVMIAEAFVTMRTRKKDGEKVEVTIPEEVYDPDGEVLCPARIDPEEHEADDPVEAVHRRRSRSVAILR